MTLTNANQLLQAFADPTRLRILNLLSGGELCVCQLVHVLGTSQPKISRHLAVLRETGLVADRKEGRWVHYRLTPSPTLLQKRLLGCVADCLGDIELLRDDRKRLAKAPRLAETACCD